MIDVSNPIYHASLVVLEGKNVISSLVGSLTDLVGLDLQIADFLLKGKLVQLFVVVALPYQLKILISKTMNVPVFSLLVITKAVIDGFFPWHSQASS